MENYLGEIRAFPYSFYPKNWLPCDGRAIKIAQNQALYSLIGNQFGSVGTDSFKLPNLNGRTIIGFSAKGNIQYKVGDAGGAESVQLTADNLPQHNHALNATDYYEVPGVNTNFLGNTNVTTLSPDKQNLGVINVYKPNPNNLISLHKDSIGISGNSGKHENRQPYMPMQYCIATMGVFPQRP